MVVYLSQMIFFDALNSFTLHCLQSEHHFCEQCTQVILAGPSLCGWMQ